MLLSEPIADKLNDQITSELAASQLYLQMSLACEAMGLSGAGAFFRSHVAEEIEHRDHIIDYMIESDAVVNLQPIPAPEANWTSLVDMVHSAYAHEKKVTEQINALTKAAFAEDDFSTFNMLQWFVAEQREEMMLFGDVVEYMNVAGFTGDTGDQMVNMDKYLRKLSK